MPNAIYNKAKSLIASGGVQYLTDTIKVLLVTDVYRVDIDTHQYLADVQVLAGAEVEGIGYTIGGLELANKAVLEDLINNRTAWDADDLVWPASTLRVRGAIIYKDTGDAATSPLLVFKDYIIDQVTTGTDLTIEWDATGIVRFEQVV